MQYIDKEQLLERIKSITTWWGDAGGAYGFGMKYPEGMFYCEEVVEEIKKLPTVDAVEVVKCKDCVYYNKEASNG